jgi:hypothetical protein
MHRPVNSSAVLANAYREQARRGRCGLLHEQSVPSLCRLQQRCSDPKKSRFNLAFRFAKGGVSEDLVMYDGRPIRPLSITVTLAS